MASMKVLFSWFFGITFWEAKGTPDYGLIANLARGR